MNEPMDECTREQWMRQAQEEADIGNAQWHYEEDHTMHHIPIDRHTQADKAECICTAMNQLTEDAAHILELIADYADQYQELPAILVTRLEDLAEAFSTAAEVVNPDTMSVITAINAKQAQRHKDKEDTP